MKGNCSFCNKREELTLVKNKWYCNVCGFDIPILNKKKKYKKCNNPPVQSKTSMMMRISAVNSAEGRLSEIDIEIERQSIADFMGLTKDFLFSKETIGRA